jgi:hypothetical protein
VQIALQGSFRCSLARFPVTTAPWDVSTNLRVCRAASPVVLGKTKALLAKLCAMIALLVSLPMRLAPRRVSTGVLAPLTIWLRALRALRVQLELKVNRKV